MKTWIVPVCLIVIGMVGCADQEPTYQSSLTNLRSEWLVTPEEARTWALIKNDNLPTLTGSPEWVNYMSFLETTLDTYGVVDGTQIGRAHV